MAEDAQRSITIQFSVDQMRRIFRYAWQSNTLECHAQLHNDEPIWFIFRTARVGRLHFHAPFRWPNVTETGRSRYRRVHIEVNYIEQVPHTLRPYHLPQPTLIPSRGTVRDLVIRRTYSCQPPHPIQAAYIRYQA